MMYKFEGDPSEFTPPRPGLRDWYASDLAHKADGMPDPELAAYIAHGAPPERLSPERIRRLCASFVDMLPAQPGRAAEDERDGAICLEVYERWLAGDSPTAAFKHVAKVRGMKWRTVQKVWSKRHDPFQKVRPDARRGWASAPGAGGSRRLVKHESAFHSPIYAYHAVSPSNYRWQTCPNFSPLHRPPSS